MRGGGDDGMSFSLRVNKSLKYIFSSQIHSPQHTVCHSWDANRPTLAYIYVYTSLFIGLYIH